MQSPRSLFLGVDGGATKTHIALMNAGREIVSEGWSGPSNPLRIGVENAVTNIAKGVFETCGGAGISRGDIVAATLGLAGVRRADLRQRVRESFVRRTGIRNSEVLTDAEIALFGVTLGKPGLVVIAGTGSVCLGSNSDGNTAVSGGWGPLAGDEGGGIGIAQNALHAVAKASDGRGIPTLLSERAAEYFRASGPENLVVAIYSPQIDNRRIAGFARYVVETAKAGDAVAIDILNEAGFELGLAACAVIAKLELERKKIPIGCVGGMFNAGDLLKAPMLSVIKTCAPRAYLTEPQMPPAHAAALMAFDRARSRGNGNRS